ENVASPATGKRPMPTMAACWALRPNCWSWARSATSPRVLLGGERRTDAIRAWYWAGTVDFDPAGAGPPSAPPPPPESVGGGGPGVGLGAGACPASGGGEDGGGGG